MSTVGIGLIYSIDIVSKFTKYSSLVDSTSETTRLVHLKVILELLIIFVQNTGTLAPNFPRTVKRDLHIKYYF